MVEWIYCALIVNPEGLLYLIELIKVGLRHLIIVSDNDQIVGEDRGVIPVKTTLYDNTIIDNTVLGMNG